MGLSAVSRLGGSEVRPSLVPEPRAKPSDPSSQTGIAWVDPPTPLDEPVTIPAAAGKSQYRGPDHEQDSPSPDQLLSIGRETWIYDAPRPGAAPIGYLRFGAVIGRWSEPESRSGCTGGWYRVVPEGFVCNNGRSATIRIDDALAARGRTRPDRLSPLPYVYARPARGLPALFGQWPNDSEQRAAGVGRSSLSAMGRWKPMTAAPAPAWLHHRLNAFGFPRNCEGSLVGRAVARSGFSLLAIYQEHGNAFALTADQLLIPLASIRPVKVSAFHGVQLSEDDRLPVAFVMGRGAVLYRGSPGSGKMKISRRVARREAVMLDGYRVRKSAVEWLRSRDGDWLQDENLVIVKDPASWPSWATDGRTWVDISISNQTLVAFDGRKAVYATLVSTGADGLADHRDSTATKIGTFEIVSKHVTATMDGNEPGEEFDLRDVPWVQYFSEGYALHAAYWHDDFGRPRSHGCVNLSPMDARWLFHFTSPGVPRGWHGAVARHQASIVNVHP